MTLVPNSRLVDSRALQHWCNDIFVATGMPEADARTAAEVLVRTSLRGIDTHGVSRAPLYAESLLNGSTNPKPDHGGEYRDGILHYRGDRGLGQVIGAAAVRQAMAIAREVPVVSCVMRQCGHLAALGAYVLIAAEAGMFAFICQSTGPLDGPCRDGRAAASATTRWPSPRRCRTSRRWSSTWRPASWRAAISARRCARRSPFPKAGPSARTASRRPIPRSAWPGAVLPFGGYKGLGIAMLVQCLAGSLVGNSGVLGSGGGGPEMGAFLLVINPQLAAGDVYAADVERMVRSLHGCRGRRWPLSGPACRRSRKTRACATAFRSPPARWSRCGRSASASACRYGSDRGLK